MLNEKRSFFLEPEIFLMRDNTTVCKLLHHYQITVMPLNPFLLAEHQVSNNWHFYEQECQISFLKPLMYILQHKR